MRLRRKQEKRRSRIAAGFTMIEILMVLLILSILAAVALPSYSEYQKKARIATAKSELTEIAAALGRHMFLQYTLPATLEEIGQDREDPWGNTYRYLNLSVCDDKGKCPNNAKPRKDKNLKPLNSDFDLYSMGPDGESAATLSTKASRDDIIRANDGQYIGIADDY